MQLRRYRHRLRPTRRSTVVGSVGGVAYALVLLFGWASHPSSGDTNVASILAGLDASVWVAYGLLGVFLTGAAMAVLFDRYRLVAPVLVVGSSLGYVWYLESSQVYMLPPTPFFLYLIGWPLVLGLIAVAAYVEKILVRPFA